MYLTDVSMQLVSMLFVLIIGLYFFMFVCNYSEPPLFKDEIRVT